MQKKITETTALNALGAPGQAKLFRVTSGVYTSRRVALVKTDPANIVLFWSDAPGQGWSSPLEVTSDSSDSSFDAVMTADGDIHLVYTEQSTGFLVSRRLTLSAGSWTTGDRVTIYDGAPGQDPSLQLDRNGTLWVSYSRLVTPSRSILVKSSVDSGASWGTGMSDAGQTISGSSMFAWSRTVAATDRIYVIYNDQDTAMSVRYRMLSNGDWSAGENIATGSPFDQNFDAAIGSDGRLGVVFHRQQLFYREFDGATWGALVTLVDHPVACPQLLFEDNVPIVTYLDLIGGEMKVARYTDRRSGSFAAPELLDSHAAPLASVVLYQAASDSYEDRTSAAASYNEADVYHSVSGCLLKDAGDAVYLGLDDRFRQVRFILSTAGTGGSLMISYWDGSQWRAFTPAGGPITLGQVTTDLLLWSDYNSLPVDWQRCSVAGQSRYWIKIEPVSTFDTGPVASQISAASEVNRLIFRR